MFERLKRRLYDAGSLTKDGLKKAMTKRMPDGTTWMTSEQFEEITGEAYSA